ncbi:MAG: hypothetical protein IT439_09125 [Phycisphaerales bacterium]|nr:hypothetical protein [Phycisphaerales bacterium]
MPGTSIRVVSIAMVACGAVQMAHAEREWGTRAASIMVDTPADAARRFRAEIRQAQSTEEEQAALSRLVGAVRTHHRLASPGRSHLGRLAGVECRRRGDYQSASTVLKLVTRDPERESDLLDANRLLGDIAWEQGLAGQAESYYQSAIETGASFDVPTTDPAWRHACIRRVAAAEAQQAWERAAMHGEDAVRFSGAEWDDASRRSLLAGSARSYFRVGMIEDGRRVLGHVLAEGRASVGIASHVNFELEFLRAGNWSNLRNDAARARLEELWADPEVAADPVSVFVGQHLAEAWAGSDDQRRVEVQDEIVSRVVSGEADLDWAALVDARRWGDLYEGAIRSEALALSRSGRRDAIVDALEACEFLLRRGPHPSTDHGAIRRRADEIKRRLQTR